MTWLIRCALAAGALGVGCVSPDAFFRDAGGPFEGAGGSIFGAGGQLGAAGSGIGGSGLGGSGVGGRAGIGGVSGVGGRTGMGGSGLGGAPGAGGSALGGRTGTGGSGTGGAPGVGGGGAAGAPGTGGAGGTVVVTGCPPGVFCDNFEGYTVATFPATWTRAGGSSGDWEIPTDTTATKVLAQDHAGSSTFRACYPTTAPGAPWTGATSVTARMKILLDGSSMPTTALLCLRFSPSNSSGYCLALLRGTGAQLQSRTGGTINLPAGGTLSMTVALDTWYNVRLSVDATGLVSGSVNGMALPTLTPATALASGSVAVATQNAEAAFDDLVVAQP